MNLSVQGRLQYRIGSLDCGAPKMLVQPPVEDKTNTIGSSERELCPDTTHKCGELLQGPSLAGPLNAALNRSGQPAGALVLTPSPSTV